MKRHPLIAGAYAGLVLAFLFLPVLVVVLFAFNASARTTLPMTGLTLRWFREAFADPLFGEALRNSITVALASAAIGLSTALSAAVVLTRRRSRLLDLVSAVAVAPMVLPGLVLGIALLSFFSQLKIQPSLLTIIVGHVLVTLPLSVLIVNARLARLDRSIEEAARDLGASGTQTFLRVVLPIVRPALVGAALVSIAWSLDEFIVTNFLNGGNPTLPIMIWGKLREGADPSINAIASLILGGTILTTAIAGRFISGRDLTP